MCVCGCVCVEVCVCVCVCVNGPYLGESVVPDELQSLPGVGVAGRVPDVVYGGHQRGLVRVRVQPELIARVGVESGNTDVDAVRADVETLGELLNKGLDLVKIALLHAARGVQQELDVGRQRPTACQSRRNLQFDGRVSRASLITRKTSRKN